MSNLIFAVLMTLLGLSDQAQHMGCNAPTAVATECWIVAPSTGVTTWMTPAGITYSGEVR